MPVWNFCFFVGAAAALVGMGLGMAMGIRQDFTLAPVHAHINLLGWVSMMLYGLYYRGAAAAGHLAWVQAGMASIGFCAMTAGLWQHLSGTQGWLARLVAPGAIMVIGSMALFATILFRDRRGSAAENAR